MSRVTCAISGLVMTTSYLEHLIIPHTEGYIHPVFTLNKHQLHKLFVSYTRGKLGATDSYLTYLAIIHSSGKVHWRLPASRDPESPETISLIAGTIAQLVSVLEKTEAIIHPQFSQPDFTVRLDTCDLETVPNWIKAWNENLSSWYSLKRSDREREELVEVGNKLEALILGGDPISKHTTRIAEWASQAAGFPPEKDELYKKTIRGCFNITTMFNTPLILLKEIKEYCECNIDIDALHFSLVLKVLKEGIARHVDYLGGSSLALGYTLLPASLSTQAGPDRDRINLDLLEAAELAAISAKAPDKEPVKSEYPSLGAYIKARLAWKVAMRHAPAQVEAEVTTVTPQPASEVRGMKADILILDDIADLGHDTDTDTELDTYELSNSDLANLSISDNPNGE